MVDDAPTNSESANAQVARLSVRLRRSLLWTASATLVATALIHRLQPDAFAAVSSIPPWCWFVACFVLGTFGFASARRWERAVAGAIALLFLAFSVEQVQSLSRSARDSLFGSLRPAKSSELRVATINCDAGNGAAAREVLAFEPDVVFLQESPSQSVVRRLARSLFGGTGSFVWSPDCTIVARGELQPSSTKKDHFVQATLTLTTGQELEVVCLRLSPPIVRYDLWSPRCWTEHAALRRQHRREAMDISDTHLTASDRRPIIIGGDFNVPAGDGATEIWTPKLHDAFKTAGRGWGATVLNTFPVQRFDQLWCSGDIKPIVVRSVKTMHSDHRMVVGDFQLSSD